MRVLAFLTVFALACGSEPAAPEPAPAPAPEAAPPPAPVAVEAPAAAADYTCPMHPEVHQAEAGTCPVCGMGLELAKVEPAPEPPAAGSNSAVRPGAGGAKGGGAGKPGGH